MARYDYRCPTCGAQFEVEHPMSEHPEVRCPSCGEVASQVFGASGIVFKGSGFYNTDQRGKGSSSGASSATSKTSASGSSGGSESKSAASASSTSDKSTAKSKSSDA